MPLTGGVRDRCIVESFYEMLEGALEDLGWFALDPPPERGAIQVQPRPIEEEDPDTPVPWNVITVSFEDVTPDDIEIGSNAQELTHVVYVEFYAQEEGLGLQVAGDIWSVLNGEFPEIGRDGPYLDVLDYTLATPDYAFSCVITNLERTRRRVSQSWQRWVYVVSCFVVETRP